jgi:hypothetical protein
MSHPIINRLSFALASGLASIISSTLTRVLQCRLEADTEMRNCLLKWVNRDENVFVNTFCYWCLLRVAC